MSDPISRTSSPKPLIRPKLADAPVPNDLLARSTLPSESSPWLTIPAFFIAEEGTIYLREPADADIHALVGQLLDDSYPKPYVVDDGAYLRLNFSQALVQTEQDKQKPRELHSAYTQEMMSFLLFNPRPKHILMVGLGGGVMSTFCYQQLARSRITNVDIDADVIAFSRLFGTPPDDERMRTVHADATRFVAECSERMDVILLDGFDKRGIAPAFNDLGFYQNVRARLRDTGILVMNLVGPEDDIYTHLQLVGRAFDQQYFVHDVYPDGNQLIFAFNSPWFAPDWDSISKQAKPLAQKHGLDLTGFARRLKKSYQRHWGG